MNKLTLIGSLLFVFNFQVSLARQSPQNTKHKAANGAIVQSLISTLDKFYILPDKARGMMEAVAVKSMKGEYAAIKNSDELAAALDKELKSVYPDKHLKVYYDPEFEKSLTLTKSAAEKTIEQDQELAYDRAHNFMFSSVRILPRNIGYVQLNGFSDHLLQAEPTATAAFRFLTYTNAIIVDLRFNGGGNPKMVAFVESYFFKNSIHMSDIQERGINKTQVYYTDPTKTGGVFLDMPVYILTSKRTFSAAEDFSYSMQQIKRAQIVGDTTAGGAHPTRPYPLKGGLIAEIPFARSVNPYSKTNWEGIGVLPEHPVTSSKGLDKALEIIYKKELTNSTQAKERRSIEWQINALKVSAANYPDTVQLQKYCGMYEGGLKIFLKNGALYCDNAERGHEIFKLAPLKQHLFSLDENAQIEFIADANRQLSLRMHFIDGNSRDKKKL